MTTDDLAAALHACAAGLYPLEAGVALLIAEGTFLRRDDFSGRFIEHGTSSGIAMAATDWDAAVTALNAGANDKLAQTDRRTTQTVDLAMPTIRGGRSVLEASCQVRWGLFRMPFAHHACDHPASRLLLPPVRPRGPRAPWRHLLTGQGDPHTPPSEQPTGFVQHNKIENEFRESAGGRGWRVRTFAV